MLGNDCQFVQVSGTGVVTKALPCFENILFFCIRQSFEIWKFLHPVFEVWKHCGYPGLLEHKFRNHGFIQGWIFSPGQVALLLIKPAQETLLKLFQGGFRKDSAGWGVILHAWRLLFSHLFLMDSWEMARSPHSSSGNGTKKKTSYTLKLTEEQMQKLGDSLHGRGWPTRTVPYARHAFDGDGVKVVAYESGKLVVQGGKTEDFVSTILEPEITGEFLLGYEEVNNPEWFEPHAGLDESGKGDLFGPVVSACVVADGEMVKQWMAAGIRDSKTITDGAIVKMAQKIKATQGVVIKTAYTSMPKYNELYGKFGENLNKLLAWLHGRALLDALELRQPKWGLLDQFSKQPLVQKYVKDPSFDLQMRTKAEEDPVVAAASIIARATWLEQMKKLEELAGCSIPKGSGSQAKEKARQLFEKLGESRMGEFCKLHFKTAYEAMGKVPPAKKAWNPNWRKK